MKRERERVGNEVLKRVSYLVPHHQRHVPDVRHVGQVHDMGGRDVAKEGQLVLHRLLQRILAPAGRQ